MDKKRIDLVFGTRPEAIKMAPLVLALKACSSEFETRVILTAQHREMLDQVMRIFNLKSDLDLDIMRPGQTLTEITTIGLERLTPVFSRSPSDLVLVHGDTTTTLMATLAAFYQKIPVGHVEAGLRSFDIYNPYPEEVNRRLCDAVCVLHFAPTQNARENLLRENVSEDGIFVTGNTGIDGLEIAVQRLASDKYNMVNGDLLELIKKPYILLTVHRRENFGEPLKNLCSAIREVSRCRPDINFIYPVHMNPSINKPVHDNLGELDNVYLLKPQEYSEFVLLMQNCMFVVTDSGGVQEEAPSLGKPVLVLRKVTERPEAVKAGTVSVIGTEQMDVSRWINTLLDDVEVYERMAKAVNPYGDGSACMRTVEAIRYYFNMTSDRPAAFIPET